MTARLDARHMRMALELAAGQLGRTAPNPSVGCVIVRDGAVVGSGATGEGGRPHAEEKALALAGDLARGAQAFVSLEPCAKRSQGGLSCAERLAASGVRRVVVAVRDPHPNARGAGLAFLRGARIEVEEGVGQAQAEAVNAGFFKRVRTGLPLLAAAEGPDTFDAELTEAPGGDVLNALRLAAQGGATRVWVRAGSPLAAAAEAAGLLDVDHVAAGFDGLV